MSTPTPRTDAATYPADCLGKTLVTNRDCPRAIETELAALTAERDQLKEKAKDDFEMFHGLRMKLTAACGDPYKLHDEALDDIISERDQLRADCENETKWAAHYLAESIAVKAELKDLKSAGGPPFIRSEAIRNLRDQVCGLKARAERAEATETVALANWNGALERALKAEADLADQTKRFHDEIVSRQGTVRANQELDLKERDHLLDLLATERARLDWFYEVASDRIWVANQDIRAAIDAAMKEDAK